MQSVSKSVSQAVRQSFIQSLSLPQKSVLVLNQLTNSLTFKTVEFIMQQLIIVIALCTVDYMSELITSCRT